MPSVNRRNFLKVTGMVAVPGLLLPGNLSATGIKERSAADEKPVIKLYGDGEMFEPADYLRELTGMHSKTPIKRDNYGRGGAVEQLEKKFAEITGKEKAIYMPSGTMANQFAIAVLSGEKTKVYVQDTSHVYRDEADAAQSVFQKRLMPLAKNETYFTADMLKNAIDALPREEVFSSGVGAVSIENPVRRTDGRVVPLEEIRKISAYCRGNNIRLHMDGARLHMAAAWSGVTVQEYSSYFDTVYISLYKYLGASGGAILCGEKSVIDKMPHLIKIHGGNMYGNWLNAAMVLHRLEGMESRLHGSKKMAEEIFDRINKSGKLKITHPEGGTNIYYAEFSKEVNGSKMQEALNKEYGIQMIPPDKDNKTIIMVNETLLYREKDYIINALLKSFNAL